MLSLFKSPLSNATGAAAYIIGIATLLSTIGKYGHDKPDNIIIPMFMLSLFVLSAAVMAFLFFYQPFRLYFDNKKQEALAFFGKTVGFFALFVALFMSVMLYIIARQ